MIIDRYADYAVFHGIMKPFIRKSRTLTAFRTVTLTLLVPTKRFAFPQRFTRITVLYGEQAPEPLLVTENGVQFATYLNEGLMTGIFLDQKVRGRLVDGFAVGKTVLNMFSYTGAFSVAAAMGGAVATTSVDLAKRSLPKTTEQFEVNHLNLARKDYCYGCF